MDFINMMFQGHILLLLWVSKLDFDDLVRKYTILCPYSDLLILLFGFIRLLIYHYFRT